MRWQIAQYVFCDQQQTLKSEDVTQQLEPMMVELLGYFCRNTNQIVSKEQLIEQVWLGRIVSDNTVSKLITKLRKVLADDVRQPRFIATFPKKGYKFIADVMPLAEQTTPTLSQHTENSDNLPKAEAKTRRLSNSKRLRFFSATSLLILLVIFSANLVWQQIQDKPLLSTYAKAITTDAGHELFPAFSPDGARVAYTSVQDNRVRLLIKNVVDESVVEISHEDNVGVGPASWSDDGKSIAYLVANPQLCQYYVRSINEEELSEPRLIHNCPAGSFGKIAFTHDNNRLIYSENEGANSPYTLFEIDLTTSRKKRLNQPELFLGGNSLFDLHPTEDKLLISSPDKQQWEGYYSLDLKTDELKLLFKQDAYTCCGIWSHDGTRVVLMGEHPAYQLLSYGLSGKEQQVIYSGSRQIRAPHRHTNGTDYLFSSGDNNLNVHAIDLVSKNVKVITDSSVDERLAALAHHSNQIAYISLSSGNEEIWLTDVETNHRKKLTQFNDSRHYVDLKWSPRGKHLLALSLNEIHLINSSDGQFERLKIPQKEIRGVSFKSESSISYSTQENELWRVYTYQLDTNKTMQGDPNWQYVQYHSDINNTLWLDQNNQLFVGQPQTPVVDQMISADTLLNGRQFNLKKRGHLWFWFDRDNGSKIQSYSDETRSLSTLVDTGVAQFDVNKNMLLFANIEQENTNIYQTQLLN
ncbi:MAG: DNA-binding winged helix-turn-helix (wHTH) protein/Tol biopolymer transport system component [Paraglaciecola sp.]|jgi:DNA-binding winged helix-turn-helix (wHTH) protein/Tol biopolymer transport system component